MKTAARHDPTHKGLFKCPTMFLSLLRSGVGTFRLPEEWRERIDPDSMRVEPTESHTRAHGERRSDLVVSFRLRPLEGEDDADASRQEHRVFFHIEFQSTRRDHMHWRFEEYIHGVRSQVARSRRDSRAVLISALVYTGKPEWDPRTHTVPPGYPFSVEEVARVTGTVLSHYMVDIHRCRIEDLSEDEILTWWICLEQAETKEEVRRALDGAGALLKPESEDGERLIELLLTRAQEIQGGTIKDLDLSRFVRDWKKGDKNVGTAVQTFGDRELARSKAKANAEARRALLHRQAEARFDADTAKRFATLIRRISSSARLDRIGEWLVTSKSGEEFLARIRNGRRANGRLPNGKASG